MNRYKLIVAYDGTDYIGWQVQPEHISIEQVLHETFTVLFHQPCKLLSASRTDAGVHALGQVVWCRTPLDISPERLRRVWSGALPPSIVIRSLVHADDSFHPHAKVKNKTYSYHFFIRRPLPFLARYGWHVKGKVDFDRLEKVLQLFVGTHDFRSFCAGGVHPHGTIRTIDDISLSYLRRFDMYRITVTGHSFMRHMIRRIVGAALHHAQSGGGLHTDVAQILAACDPNHHLPTAPAQGLLLHAIRYKE